MLVLVVGRGQMACSGRGSGMKTEWVRWMGPEPGGRAHAERPDAVRTSHAAKPRNERPLGRGRGEDGGRRLHTDEALGSVPWLCPEAGDVRVHWPLAAA